MELLSGTYHLLLDFLLASSHGLLSTHKLGTTGSCCVAPNKNLGEPPLNSGTLEITNNKKVLPTALNCRADCGFQNYHQTCFWYYWVNTAKNRRIFGYVARSTCSCPMVPSKPLCTLRTRQPENGDICLPLGCRQEKQVPDCLGGVGRGRLIHCSVSV